MCVLISSKFTDTNWRRGEQTYGALVFYIIADRAVSQYLATDTYTQMQQSFVSRVSIPTFFFFTFWVSAPNTVQLCQHCQPKIQPLSVLIIDHLSRVIWIYSSSLLWNCFLLTPMQSQSFWQLPSSTSGYLLSHLIKPCGIWIYFHTVPPPHPLPKVKSPTLII